MNGRTHISYGMLLTFIVYLFLVWFSVKNIEYGFPPFLAWGIGSSFGTLFPDFDMFVGNGYPTYHRNTLSHSSILPLLSSAAYFFSPDYGLSNLLMFVCLGMATHLGFDMIRGEVPKEKSGSLYSRWSFRLEEIGKRRVAGTFKGISADYANAHEFRWLFTNVIVCIGCAVALFIKIYCHIDLDWWFK